MASGKIEFSMNGFRQNLSNCVDVLRDIARDVANDEFFDKEDFVSAVNNVIANSNALNCVYSTDDPNFNDMSHVELEQLEVDDQGRY